MSKQWSYRVVFFYVVIMLSGCGSNYVTRAEQDPINKVQENALLTAPEEENVTEETETTETTNNGQRIVVIQAHIKEIEENSILISSNSDGYPGAFYVEVPREIDEVAALKGGDTIIIQMESMQSKNAQGLDQYLAIAIDIMEAGPQVTTGSKDILLTAAPIISLTDVLSSTFSAFEVQSGSYSWSYKVENQIEHVVACGVAPLDADAVGNMDLFDVKNHNQMDKTIYSFGCVKQPDSLMIREWDREDIGNSEAEEICNITFYCQPFLLKLQQDKVYEIVTKWNESNLDNNGFYGEASYVLVTE